MAIVSDYGIVIGNLKFKMVQWPWKNSWSIVWCLCHQSWGTRCFFKAEQIRHSAPPQKICHPQEHTVYPGWHDAPLPTFPDLWWDMCSQFTITIQSLTKSMIGWSAGVQRRSLWPDLQPGSHMISRCSLQMTTRRSSSATSCCEYGVVNRQLQC